MMPFDKLSQGSPLGSPLLLAVIAQAYQRTFRTSPGAALNSEATFQILPT